MKIILLLLKLAVVTHFRDSQCSIARGTSVINRTLDTERESAIVTLFIALDMY